MKMGGRAMTFDCLDENKKFIHPFNEIELRPPRSDTSSRRLRINEYTRCGKKIGDDPSAGSPTETLLRLLLPLNDQV